MLLVHRRRQTADKQVSGFALHQNNEALPLYLNKLKNITKNDDLE